MIVDFQQRSVFELVVRAHERVQHGLVMLLYQLRASVLVNLFIVFEVVSDAELVEQPVDSQGHVHVVLVNVR